MTDRPAPRRPPPDMTGHAAPRSAVLDPERFIDLVELGIRAPSVHNSQPWRFRRRGDAVEILSDAGRALPATDPTGWGTRLAIGAAAYNVRLGYLLLGWAPDVQPFPEPAQPDLLVRVRPIVVRPATPAERTCADAIPRRHTNRRPYLDARVPDPMLAELAEAATADSCRLTVLGPRAHAEVAGLLRDADQELERRPGYTAERRAWVRGLPAGPDGISWDLLAGRPHPDEPLRRRDFGEANGSLARRYESDPCVAVLTTSSFGRYDELRAGQALQHVLLLATASGLTSSLFSQVIEVPATRTQLGRVVGGGVPQMVLRFGYGLAHGPTSRRAAPDVVEE
ncbi:Acg family FMN-binding oxidoreductase [Cryptosporangium sp. NPDC051539]|uniref:Acg family FMN-binding oxidoreductase n=1 Tax=Cryptosporangium sp. NPDC051539 TaxID=3363962 RepID=UPI0037A99155